MSFHKYHMLYLIELGYRYNYHSPVIIVKASSPQEACLLIKSKINPYYVVSYKDNHFWISCANGTHINDRDDKKQKLEHELFKLTHAPQVIYYGDGEC